MVFVGILKFTKLQNCIGHCNSVHQICADHVIYLNREDVLLWLVLLNLSLSGKKGLKSANYHIYNSDINSIVNNVILVIHVNQNIHPINVPSCTNIQNVYLSKT